MIPSSVRLESLHTPAMIRRELLALGGIPVDPVSGDACAAALALTAGALLRLLLDDSPFLSGGDVFQDDLDRAREILELPDLSADEVVEALATAFRPLECIQPLDSKEAHTLDYEGLCPEWFADLYAAVCRSAPATSWNDFLNEMPLATAAHLAAAAHRSNGGHTMRPFDFARTLRSLNASE